MSRIVSKIHKYGNDRESDWPSQYGTLDKTPKYIDPVTKELKDGYPPAPEIYEQAPMLKFDTMRNPEYHESAGRKVDSWQEWKRLDKETGQLSWGSVEEKERHSRKNVEAEKKELKDDRRNASLKALQEYKENPQSISDKASKRKLEQEKSAKKSGLTKLIKEAI